MRNLITFLILLCGSVVIAQNAGQDPGYPKPSYIRWLPDTTQFHLLVGDTTTKTGAWFQLGSGFVVDGNVISVSFGNPDSVFVLGDSLCAISLGDTVCVANDSVYITQDSFCYIVDGDTSCVAFSGVTGPNIYNTSDTITSGENRVVTIPSASTLAFKESGSTNFIKMYPTGDSTVFEKRIKLKSTLLDYNGNAGSSGYVLESTATGVQWDFPSVPINLVTAATGPATANHTDKSIEWQWNSLGAATGLKLSTTSTVQGVGPSQRLLEIAMSGAHASIDKTSVGGYFSNTHTGTGAINFGIFSHASGASSANYGIMGDATSGYGVYGGALTGYGLYGYATTGTPMRANGHHTTTNSVTPILDLYKSTSGTAANGLGGSITFTGQTSSSSAVMNTISSEWTEVNHATRGSKFSLSGVTSATTQNVLEILGSGATRLNKYGIGTFTGTPAYTLQVDANGNIIEGATSGSTKLNSITAADGNASPNHGASAIDWQWNTLGAGTGLKLSSTSTLASGSTQKLFELSQSGANATANQATYAGYFSNTKTGSNNTNYGLYSIASGGTNDYGIYGSGDIGVYGIGSTRGIIGFSSTSNGVLALSTTGTAFVAEVEPVTTNNTTPIAQFIARTSGTAADGFGGFLLMNAETSSGTAQESNRLISRWTTANNATRTSQFVIQGINSTAAADVVYFDGDKRTRFNGRAQMLQGADVASASTVTLGYDGNVFEITGTTTVDNITSTGWQNGSEITLLFSNSVTLAHDNGGGGVLVGFQLAGGVDFNATSGDIITLVLAEIGGTAYWREKSRSVN